MKMAETEHTMSPYSIGKRKSIVYHSIVLVWLPTGPSLGTTMSIQQTFNDDTIEVAGASVKRTCCP